jgi:tetratricopeptide (TPR) repeat protein
VLWSLLLIGVLSPMSSAQVSAQSDDGALANARNLFRQADFQGAAAAYRKALGAKPSAEAYEGLVRSLLKADDVKAADEISKKAAAALPESPLVHAARGDVYFRRGMIPQAEDEYRAALKLDDKSARAWLGQGKVDALYTRHSKAKTAFAKPRR